MFYFRENLSLRANAEREIEVASKAIAEATANFAEDPARFISWNKQEAMMRDIWLLNAMKAVLRWLDDGRSEAEAEQFLVEHAINAATSETGLGEERLREAHCDIAKKLLYSLGIDLRSSAAVLLVARNAKRAEEAEARAQRVWCRKVRWNEDHGFWHIVEHNADGRLLRSLSMTSSNKVLVLKTLKEITPAAPRNELLKKDGSLERVL